MKLEFTEQLNSLIKESGIFNKEIRSLFGVSKGTVNRWISGETAPHNLLKKVVLDNIGKFKLKT